MYFKCLVCCGFLFSVRVNGLSSGPRARNSCFLNLILKPSVFWTSQLTWLHPKIITWKMCKKFLLSIFLHKTVVRRNYCLKSWGNSLVKSPNIVLTDFLLFIINFPKSCTLRLHPFVAFWFCGFFFFFKKEKVNISYLRILRSSGIQRNNNWEDSFPLQTSCTRD